VQQTTIFDVYCAATLVGHSAILL